MILFKIKFDYKGEEIEGSVHEVETPPKQWHITVTNEILPPGLRGTQYDTKQEIYTWGGNNFDTDHSFGKGESLIDYLKIHGRNSVIFEVI